MKKSSLDYKENLYLYKIEFKRDWRIFAHSMIDWLIGAILCILLLGLIIFTGFILLF